MIALFKKTKTDKIKALLEQPKRRNEIQKVVTIRTIFSQDRTQYWHTLDKLKNFSVSNNRQKNSMVKAGDELKDAQKYWNIR